MSTLESHELSYGDGKKTFYHAAGPVHGPLIIFIHGWPAIGKMWKPQLEVFSALGFRAVAPDMPGYGRSTARKVTSDYSMENVNKSMVALLEHLGRDKAIWIGHDWGCGAVWSFAEHFPSQCVAVAGLAVPSHRLEFGLEKLLSAVDRNLYPQEKFPWGQWSYQNFYEQDFEKAAGWFDLDPEATLKKLYARGGPGQYGVPAVTSRVTEDGGWFGGLEKPDPKWREIPIEKIAVPDQEVFDELVEAMKRNSFWGADAWYANHKANATYAEKMVDGGYLHMPVLFIEAKWDSVCHASNPMMTEGMRKYCKDLTYVTIESGHWVAEEKPRETSAAITRWILENCGGYWPYYWSNGHVKSQL